MKRASEQQQPKFQLALSQNVFPFPEFKSQLQLAKARDWKFTKKKVVIIDLDETGLLTSVLANDPNIQKTFNQLNQEGIAICFVTNKTLKENEASLKTVQSLFEKFPKAIDIILFDPGSFFSSPTENKKAMLDCCVNAYSADTAFCYIGYNDDILEYANKQHYMLALNIFYSNGLLRVPKNTLLEVDVQKCAALTIALAKASNELSHPTIARDQNHLRQLPRSPAFDRSRGQGAAVSRTTGYNPGQHSRGRELPLDSTRSSFGSSSYGSAPNTRTFNHSGGAIGYSRLDEDASQNLQTDKSLSPISTGVASRSAKDWGIHHFSKLPSFSEVPSTEGKTFRQAMGIVKQYLYANLVLAPFKALFLIFPFDGLDPVTNMISYASGAKAPEPYSIESFKDVSIKLLITTLIGFPSRAIKDPKTGKPTISLVQILKNFVGNIDWEKDTPRDKKRLQVVGIPLKVLVFLPIKIVLIPFKAILNGLKLLTEFLPWLATSLSYFVYQIPVLGSSKTWQWKNDLTKGGWGPVPLLLTLLSGILALVSVPLFFFHVFCRTVMVTGRTITSPLISLRKAFTVGSELKVPGTSETSQRRLAIVIGVLCAAVSVFITTISWMILWPLFVNYAIANMPTLMSIVNGILGSQPVTASLSALQGATTTVGAFLHAVFGGFVAGLSNFMGVQITYTAIVAVTALPFALAFSALADYLSDRWANWHDGEIFKSAPVVVPAPKDSSGKSSHSPNNPPAEGSVQLSSTGRAPATAPTFASKPSINSLGQIPIVLKEAQGLLGEVKADVKRDEQRLIREGKLTYGQATKSADDADNQGKNARRALRGGDFSQQQPASKGQPPAAKAPATKSVPRAPVKRKG